VRSHISLRIYGDMSYDGEPSAMAKIDSVGSVKNTRKSQQTYDFKGQPDLGHASDETRAYDARD
jgi:hypothetical protein